MSYNTGISRLNRELKEIDKKLSNLRKQASGSNWRYDASPEELEKIEDYGPDDYAAEINKAELGIKTL